jgi:hypothetical protein
MKIFLLSLSLVALGTVNAQNCTKLFISEYVEGWANNKALEIYNPTANPINLSGYVVARYSNGSPTALVNNAIQLSGTVPAYGVFVAVVDQRDTAGTGNTAPVWDSLQARADGFFANDYLVNTSFYWNGDDAIVLFQGSISGASSQTQDLSTITPTLVPIDIFGKIGQRPTNLAGGFTSPTGGWSTGPDYASGPSRGAIVTFDHSMIRKSTIQTGQTNAAISGFNPLLEWDSIPAVIPDLDINGNLQYTAGGVLRIEGNWNSLGFHTCACSPVGAIKDVKNNEVALSIYPNPSADGIFVIEGSDMVSITVQNSLGQVVKNIAVDATKESINLNDRSGIYFVSIIFENGSKTTKRVIVK